MFAVVHSPLTPHQRKTLILRVPNGHVVILTYPLRCPQHVGLSFVEQALTQHVVKHVATSGVQPFVPNRRVVVNVPRPPCTRRLWRWIAGHLAERVCPARHQAHRRARSSSTSSSVFSVVPLMRSLIQATRPRAHSLFSKTLQVGESNAAPSINV